ncbi:queuosine precursor transporter [bacterium]|nr:queuosine precursor transporter [bacterium]
MSQKNELLHPIEISPLQAKRERVFLLLAGLFLGSLTMLNILGVSRFISLLSISGEDGTWNWWKSGVAGRDTMFAIAIGVLPYPITFLCTDLICEFYGRKRASWVVIVGLVLNFWVIFILWIAGAVGEQGPEDQYDGLPQINIKERTPDGLSLDIQFSDEPELSDEEAAAKKQEELNKDYYAEVPYEYAFFQMRTLAFGAVFASMIAYLLAQFVDVYLFHFWKRVTRGKHLWLRNNGSTLISQLVDTVAVLAITHFFAKQLFVVEGMSTNEVWGVLFVSFILPSYAFKFVVALLDTIPFYGLVAFLNRYLEIEKKTD